GAGTSGFGPSTATLGLKVNPIPLPATAVNITTPLTAAVTRFSGTVATFSDPDPFHNSVTYYAWINWGDGIEETGTITGTGTFTVSGSHVYADPGNYTLIVQIIPSVGYIATATVYPTATVTSLGLTVQRGMTGDIGFWHEATGQALINTFNGGPNAT